VPDCLDYVSIESHLSDPLTPSATYLSQIANVYQATKDMALRGVAGFQLFISTALGHPAEGLEAPDSYLRDEAVVAYIYNNYCQLPHSAQEKLNSLTFYKAGTTSFILHSDEQFVLKIIQPRFQHTRTITSATERYFTDYRYLGRFAPKVYASGKVWILMDFIPGQTLAEFVPEYLYSQPKTDAKTAKQLKIVAQIVRKICEALATCLKQYEKHHLDLSPNNIIVTHDHGTIIDIHLIDFGVNYLLQEHVGSVGGLSRAQIFIAPELQDALSRGNEVSDVFSIGMILLEMLGDDLLEKESLSLELDAAWLRSPDIAELVEDMIDEDVANRFLNVPRGKLIFNEVEKRVTAAVKVSSMIQADNRSFFGSVIEIAIDIVPLRSIKELMRRWRAAKEAPNSEIRFLLVWGILVQCTHLMAVFAFVLLALAPHDVPFIQAVAFDKRACDLFNWCISAKDIPPLPIWDGAWASRINGLLPGRIVALSFSIILARYYANIFATVTFSHINLRDMRKTLSVSELLMRAHPIVGLFPILYALIVDPKAWPYCSALGLLCVCLNNLFTYRIGMECENKALAEDLFVRPSPFMKSTLADFSEWWRLILLYVATLIIVGVLLSRGLAKDEWLYAIYGSIAINMLMLFRVNCVNHAPAVRTMLRRVTWWLKRVEKRRGEGTHREESVIKAVAVNR
jgi:serine/threonine protein kinase